LVDAQTGKQVFGKDYFILKDRKHLLVAKNISKENTSYFIDLNENMLKFPLKICISNTSYTSTKESNAIFVDSDLLKFPLELRKWQDGDVFYPIGMQGKKKLSKYFKDEKMSLIEKSNQWVLVSDNQIVWVVGKRQDDRFKITEKTNNKLQITVE
jgi:tRNA(Ile)-lysidine synthase